MPIADGMASTKMIRAHEATATSTGSSTSLQLSPRAQLNGRVPIIAVSASLVEKERQKYIDTGFDGWILKPISFPRLNELMKGIVDTKTKEEALYVPGQWERGGWFQLESGRTASTVKGNSPATGASASGAPAAPPASASAEEGKQQQEEVKTSATTEATDFASGEQGAQPEVAGKDMARTAPNAPAELARTPSDGSAQIFATPMSTPPVEERNPLLDQSGQLSPRHARGASADMKQPQS